MDKTHTFEEELRQALNRLYDPVYLRKSPLVSWLKLGKKSNTAKALRTTLEKAIRSLKPARCPYASKSYRYYQILFYRYVQQFTQFDVAKKLAISPRHLRREQDAAVSALANCLFDRFNLSEDKLAAIELSPTDTPPLEMEGVEREMSWLRHSLSNSLTLVQPVVAETLDLVKNLAERYEVQIDLDLVDLPTVFAPHTMLKQIMLNLVTRAIQSVPKGQVQITVTLDGAYAAMRITTKTNEASPDLALGDGATEIGISRRLVEMLKGELDVSQSGTTLATLLRLPSAGQIIILAVEDNADTLKLWQRYVQDRPYRLIGVQEPQQALAMAVELQPRLIVLDVMMPQLDGWELLAQFQNHPATQHIPIVVCTVHPQEELAYSLGASDFIHKPATRQTFLNVLERRIAALASAQ
jgi:CheY-like chemotaxis protein